MSDLDLQQELADLKELQALRVQKAELKSGITVTDLAQSFNKGLVDLINLPSELINIPLGITGLPQIPTGGFRQKTADIGLTAQPGSEATGFLPRSAEILGASVLPGAAIQRAGAQVLKAGIPTAQRTITQQLTATTAASPGKAAALDIASSVGAGFGGQVASSLSDDPNMILLGELAGGFSFPAVSAAGRFLTKPAIDKIKQTVTPFTRAGAEPRAARRLQGLSADPRAEAARIDLESPISAARQTGNPRLIALEKAVLDSDPALEAKFTDDLKAAIESARNDAIGFGDFNRAREILRRGQDHLTNLVNLRAATAAQSAQIKIAELGDATPRQISRIARSELDSALKSVRAEETRLWKTIDKKAPASFDNAREALNVIKADESKLVPIKVPAWLSKAIDTKKPVNFNDVQQVRSKVLNAAREASSNNKFNKARLLNNIADGLLVDMGAVKDPATDAALAFSRQLNEKFTRGSVAQLLSRGANVGAGVDPADTLNQLLSGRTPATNVKAFIRASPESAPQIQQFIRSSFASRVTKGGKFNQGQAQTQIDKLEAQGMFEVFPSLKGELDNVGIAFQKASDQAATAAIVTERGGARLAHDSKKSLAGLLLGAEPGQEMNVLLRSENPEAMAATLKRRMGNNQDAIQGLKSSFVEELFASASKTDGEVSGKQLAKLFNENMGVAKALGMNSAEISRLQKINRVIIQAQQAPGGKISAILEDKPAAFMSLIARVIGAQAGQKVSSGGIGSALVIAGEGAQQATNLLQKLTTNQAQKLLVAAQSDPKLFKALLTRTSESANEIFDSIQVIESWIIGAGVESASNENLQ